MQGLTTDQVRRIESARKRRLMAVTVKLTDDEVAALVKREGIDVELPITAVEGVAIMPLIEHYGWLEDVLHNVDDLNIQTKDGAIYFAVLNDFDNHALTAYVSLR